MFKGVYEPAEDTWLLLKILTQSLPLIKGKTLVDVCTGSGVVGLYLVLKGIVSRAVLIDIDSRAVANAYHNVVLKNARDRVVVARCDLLSCIKNRSVDVIVANPPYLPVEERLLYHDLEAGRTGVEVLSMIIEQASEKLVEKGLLYIVFSSLSSPDRVYSLLVEKGFKINRIVSEHYFFEDLIAVEAVLSETS